jgi:hypothetical protein
MRVDKAGEYRTSSGQMIEIYTIFAGSAYGYVVTEGVTTWWRTEDGSHPTQAELRIVGKWDELAPAKPPQTAQRLEDLQLVVAQTLERLQKLQRYQIEPERSGMPMMYHDLTGDWMEFDDMLNAIKDLRRAMGDCTLDEEVA